MGNLTQWSGSPDLFRASPDVLLPAAMSPPFGGFRGGILIPPRPYGQSNPMERKPGFIPGVKRRAAAGCYVSPVWGVPRGDPDPPAL